MKVRIDKAHPQGWYYTPDSVEASPESARTYIGKTLAEVTAAALAAGHAVNNAGWKKKLISWHFTEHSLDDYPGWETEQLPDARRRTPAFVKLAHVRGKGDVESNTLCNAWDDVATVGFYQRDWTDDGIPFVRAGTTYWSGWWFETFAERDRFLEWLPAGTTVMP